MQAQGGAVRKNHAMPPHFSQNEKKKYAQREESRILPNSCHNLWLTKAHPDVARP
jgi:hypothetical protein